MSDIVLELLCNRMQLISKNQKIYRKCKLQGLKYIISVQFRILTINWCVALLENMFLCITNET
jgi:hypothetical protein